MSSHTQSGMQQKAGTNFDGPKPVDAPLSLHAASAPAGGGFAAMAARMAAAGGTAQQPAAKPKSAAAPAADSSSPASSAPAAALAAGSCLTTSRSAAPRIVVLDSGAFISAGSVQLHATSAGFELLARLYRESSEAAAATDADGSAAAAAAAPIRFVTIAAVLAELKDERTRQMMAALPFQIEVMEVQAEAIKEVYRFAQLTGDAKTLSVTDVQVVALAYQLEKQFNGMNFLKTEPRRGKAMDAVAALGSNTTAAAVTAASKQQAAAATADSASTVPAAVSQPAADSAPLASAPAPAADEPQHEEHESDSDDAVEEEEKTNDAAPDAAASAPSSTAAVSAAASEDNDGEGAWITPSNLHRHARPAAAAASDVALPIESAIACITTDYAMQNVLLQLGCRLLNLRGRSIRSIRSWMKKCHACDALSPDMAREFCDRCGHHSMIRVNVTVNAAGLVRFWHGTRHLNLRGTIYSIPRPRAGRHAANLKLSEDVIDERIRKGGGQGYGDKHAASKTAAQMFADSVEFGLGRTGPNNNQNVFGYGRKNPNAHSGHAQQKKKGGRK